MTDALPCRINGVDYPSQRAAAAALGVTPSAISNAIIHGRENNVRRYNGLKGNTRAKAKPLVVGEYRWRSQNAAAKALGVPHGTMNRWLKDNPERLIAAVMAYSMRDAA